MVSRSATERPLVGIGVMVLRGGRVLLGKRTASHGVGEYALPGGHLEHLETITTCAEREVAEECGLKLKNIRFQFAANVRAYAPKHYLHVGLLADWAGGEPQVLEPGKCAGWAWYDLVAPPRPLFQMSRLALDSYRTGTVFYEL